MEADSGIIAANEIVEKLVKDINLKKSDKRRVFLVGDSTVSPFKDPFFIPRNGYGMKMQDYISPEKAEVVNLAISGRSSKSFLTEKNYAVLQQFIKNGDYLIIAFGHNDEKLEEARYSNANGSKETKGSFKFFLYEKYIKMARTAGAVPVLCTPIVRRSPTGVYSGVFIHITPDSPGYPGGNYPKAIRGLGAETEVTVIDNTAMTKCLYERIGGSENAKFHAQKTSDIATLDNTHLNAYGASVMAKMVVEDLARRDSVFAGVVK